MKSTNTVHGKYGILTACALCAFGAAAANAEGRIDRSFETSSQNCSDVRWAHPVLQRYPNISDSCQSIMKRNGKTYALLEGTVEEVSENGKRLRVDLEDGGEITLTPPPDATLYLDGTEKSFASLERGYELNFYIPEDQFRAEFQATADPLTLLIVPIVDSKASGSAKTAATAGSSSAKQSSSSQASAANRPMSASSPSTPPPAMLFLIPAEQRNAADEAKRGGCWATLFAKENFAGDSLTLIGPIDMEKMIGPFGIDWDDKLSSIRTGPNATVTLYDNESYRDRSARVQPGKSVPEISGRMGLFEEVESMLVSCNR